MFNVKAIHEIKWPLAALLLIQVALLGSCGEPTEIHDGVVDDGVDELRGWTGYTSEEYAPLTCDERQAVSGANCIGRYCDDISLYCSDTGRGTGGQTWLPYFSEEGSGTADEGHCPGSDMWVTGLGCKGSYCDNLSLLCTQFPGSSTGSCEWSDPFSEEQGPFIAPWGYIKGIACDGSYCDNKQYLYCSMQ
jgi:hypothetical protein